LSTKRQVTIPVGVVHKGGFQPGDEFSVEVDDEGRIVLERTETPSERRLRAIDETAGMFTGLYPPGYLDRLRDEWR
jgi:bifunctional DNA-binding transcriptional regulator/antitoxin component of YhaV-PrlF toxin-antitoxin module